MTCNPEFPATAISPCRAKSIAATSLICLRLIWIPIEVKPNYWTRVHCNSYIKLLQVRFFLPYCKNLVIRNKLRDMGYFLGNNRPF
jgi:hypothetical protein